MNKNFKADSCISVIITCYNEGGYIEECLKSVRSQTVYDRVSEVIIIDDGSDEETINKLQKLEGLDAKFHFIYGAGGVGLSGQRCIAINRSSSEFFAILDADDYWVEDKLEKQISTITKDVGIGLVYSDYFMFPDQGVNFARRAGVLDICTSNDLEKEYFLNDPPIIPSTTLIRRSAYEQSGGFDPKVVVFEDTDLFVRMGRVCRFGLVNSPLTYKRYHKKSITGGRKDLLAHHAYVAFKAASCNSDLLGLVPKRLSERARKLGNQKFLMNDVPASKELLSLAVKLSPFNRRSWLSLVAVTFFPKLSMKLIGKKGREIQSSLGVAQ